MGACNKFNLDNGMAALSKQRDQMVLADNRISSCCEDEVSKEPTNYKFKSGWSAVLYYRLLKAYQYESESIFCDQYLKRRCEVQHNANICTFTK